MQTKVDLTSGVFTTVHDGAASAVLYFREGGAGLHVGDGTPTDGVTIDFAAGDKWIVPAGNQIRARGLGRNASIIVATLA